MTVTFATFVLFKFRFQWLFLSRSLFKNSRFLVEGLKKQQKSLILKFGELLWDFFYWIKCFAIDVAIDFLRVSSNI